MINSSHDALSAPLGQRFGWIPSRSDVDLIRR
jgi:hypothetical protein